MESSKAVKVKSCKKPYYYFFLFLQNTILKSTYKFQSQGIFVCFSLGLAPIYKQDSFSPPTKKYFHQEINIKEKKPKGLFKQ